VNGAAPLCVLVRIQAITLKLTVLELALRASSALGEWWLNERRPRVFEGVRICQVRNRSAQPLHQSRSHGCISKPSSSVRLQLSQRREMKIELMPNTGAWRVSDVITNGQTSWVEIRTFYGIDEKQAIASFYNTIWSMGWQPL
jgi:hypothetical protein